MVVSLYYSTVLTLKLSIRSFLMIAGIDEVTQRVRLVESEHEVGKFLKATLIICLCQTFEISVYFDYNILVISEVGVVTKFVMDCCSQ